MEKLLYITGFSFFILIVYLTLQDAHTTMTVRRKRELDKG